MAEGEDAPSQSIVSSYTAAVLFPLTLLTLEEDRDEWVRAIETVKESVVPAVVEEKLLLLKSQKKLPAVAAE